MLRTQLSAVLFLAAALVHADDGIDKYVGEYTAKTVCDSHMQNPHIRKNGKFKIAKFVNKDGKERAIIAGGPGFSGYDWWEVEFEYHPGKEYRDIEVKGPDETRSLSAFLEKEEIREHLRAEYHFHEHRKCSRDESGKNLVAGAT